MPISPKTRTPMKFTQSIQQRSQGYSPKNPKAAPKLIEKRYYFHFSNGVYMGGIDSYRKNGKGIMLLDDGSCLITNYSNNSMFGHNIMFHRNSIGSILVDNHGNRDVCFRFQQYILQVFINKRGQITGQGYLFNLSNSSIFYMKFRNSKLVSKVKIQDQDVKKKVFTDKQYEYLISNPHAEAIRLQIKGLEDIKLHQQSPHNYFVGFKGQGLGFKFELLDRNGKLTLTIQERGRYANSQLNQYGETHFQNGNYYVGNFRNGKYNGSGVLVDPKAKKWTLGSYFDHQLMEILDSSVHAHLSPNKSSRKHRALATVIREFHKYDRSFIQEQVKIFPTHCFAEGVLENILTQNMVGCGVLNCRVLEDENSEKLHQIFTDFTKGSYQQDTEEAIRKVSQEKKKSRVVEPEQIDKQRIKKDKKKIIQIAQKVKNYIALNDLEPPDTLRDKQEETRRQVQTPKSPYHDSPRNLPYFKSPLKNNYEPSDYSTMIEPYLNSKWRAYTATKIYPNYSQTLAKAKDSRKKPKYQYTDVKYFERLQNSSPYNRGYSPIRRG